MMAIQQSLLVVIVGPTGIGKSALALQLAAAWPATKSAGHAAEIVSADSRQIYRGMDVGTAKPTPGELAQVPHHLIDLLDPDQGFSLVEYQERAYAAIDDVLARGHLPLLVGGTGQYVRAVVEGWRIPRVAPDSDLRAALQAEAEQEGHQALYERLIEMDPDAADFVDARNVRRVIRALEVCLKSGRPFSEQRGSDPPPYDVLIIGLTMERDALYQRVDARVDRMVAQGLVQEMRGLVSPPPEGRGYDWSLPALSSLGYVQLRGFLKGRASLDECIVQIKHDTHRFIRQQYAWFRAMQARNQVHWLDVGEVSDPVARTQFVLDLVYKELEN